MDLSYKIVFISNVECLSCVYGFFQSQTKGCVLNCGSGMFGNSSSLICETCLSPCLTCHEFIGTKCTSCLTGYVYYDSTCLVQCPNGFYSDLNTSICLDCDNTC